MEFKTLERTEETKKRFLSNCRDKFIEVYNTRGNLSVEEYKELVKDGANSYERRLLMEVASKDLIRYLITYYLTQAGNEFHYSGTWILNSSYNDEIKHYMIHKLIE